MLLKPYDLGCLAHAAYLVADQASGIAAIVDPQRDIDPYLQDASQLGLDIRYTFLTHFHADFLAGPLVLRERVGATVCLGLALRPTMPFGPFMTANPSNILANHGMTEIAAWVGGLAAWEEMDLDLEVTT